MEQNPKDFLELMERYVAGTLDPRQEDQFRDRLAADARARQQYLEYMDMNAALHWTLHGALPSRSRPSIGCEGAMHAQTASILAGAPKTTLALTKPTHLYSRSRRWSLAAAAALIIAATASYVTRTRQKDTSVAQPLRPTVFRVASGSATLDLPNVGQIVLEGPTELELLNPMRARLNQGRIRARVTEACGFVVEYPDGKVTDLGTEFGISVPPVGSTDARTSLIVFDGAVDLERNAPTLDASHSAPVERLTQGEGVCFRTKGELARVMSIVTGSVATFQSAGDANGDESNRVILDVEDNLRSSDTKKFYEIVPRGLREDAICFVDRPKHEWNGVTMEGLPRYLMGADYIKTFCDDKSRTDLQIKVRLGRPANLYVFFRDQLEPPEWLTREFHKTDDKVGMDLGRYPEMPRSLRWKNAKGAGNSVDQQYGVWVRRVDKPGVVTLGANRSESDRSMYGIAAVALDSERRAESATRSNGLKSEAVEK